nr:MAG: ORF1 [TTV-like mini virus]
MAPYKRRRYFYRRWKPRWRRFSTYRRRPRTTFWRRRKRYTVRRNKFFKKKFKKLKAIKLKQWQPQTIKKCHIKGFLPLFEGGDGRQEQNYTMFKNSFTPPHEPGGGGWSIQQLGLGILYKENSILQNYWTKSNYRLNMCRYIGCKITCYRQPFCDYILHYFHDPPKNVTKYYYASFHPSKMLQLKNKVIVPSFATQPLKRKPTKKIWVPPPKPFENRWFFQQHLSNFTLIHLAATAVSLTNMYGSSKAINNNCTILSLNTVFFTHPCFQFRQQTKWAYTPNANAYLFGIPQPPISGKATYASAVYLGQSMLNESGHPGTKPAETLQKNNWGNPFHWIYLTGSSPTFITNSSKTPDETITDTTFTNPIAETQYRKTDSIIHIRYNPYKDLGKGNKIYLIPTYAYTHNTWEPTSDKDIILEDFPLWIMLWGFENIIKAMGKCTNLDYDWVLVMNCSYVSETEPYIVPLSDYFVNGQGPYDVGRDELNNNDYTHWYPCYRYQREAVHDIISTGPAVFRSDHEKNMQAIIKYNFYFKWGGNPSPMENVYDPNSQPITPYPPGQQLQNEIIDPATNIQSFIYPWDCRRDFLTQTATKRINQSSIYETTLFTDGNNSTTNMPLFPQSQTPQTTTPQEEEATLLFQLEQLQQFNNQLQQRFQHLKSILKEQ